MHEREIMSILNIIYEQFATQFKQRPFSSLFSHIITIASLGVVNSSLADIVYVTVPYL